MSEVNVNPNHSSKYRWFILIMFLLVGALTGYLQMQPSMFAGEMMSAYNLSTVQFTTVMTATMLLGLFVSFIIGAMADKLGVKKTMCIGFIITAIGCLIRIFSSTYMILFIGTFIMGFMSSVVSATQGKIGASWFSPKEIGIFMGACAATGNLGTFAVYATSGFLPSLQYCFVLGLVLVAIFAVIWFIFGRDAKETSMTEAAHTAEVKPDAPKLKTIDILKMPKIWLVALASVCYMSVAMSNGSYMPTATSVIADVDIAQAGIVSSVYTIAATIGAFLIPTFIMRQKNTKPFCVVSSLLGGVAFFAAFNLTNSIPAIIGCNIVSGFCFASMIGLILGIPALLPEIGVAHAGTAGGIVATIMMASGFVVPSFVVSNIAGDNYGLMYTIIAIMCVLMGLVFALLPNIKQTK